MFFHPGASCRAYVGEQCVGWYGLLSPELVRQYEFPHPIGFFELNLDIVLEGWQRHSEAFTGIPRFPGIRRDVSLLVDRHVPAASVEASVRAQAGRWFQQCALFDVYEGELIPADKKGLTYAVYYQDPDRTLTDEEVVQEHQRMIEGIKAAVGADIRS